MTKIVPSSYFHDWEKLYFEIWWRNLDIGSRRTCLVLPFTFKASIFTSLRHRKAIEPLQFHHGSFVYWNHGLAFHMQHREPAHMRSDPFVSSLQETDIYNNDKVKVHAHWILFPWRLVGMHGQQKGIGSRRTCIVLLLKWTMERYIERIYILKAKESRRSCIVLPMCVDNMIVKGSRDLMTYPPKTLPFVQTFHERLSCLMRWGSPCMFAGSWSSPIWKYCNSTAIWLQTSMALYKDRPFIIAFFLSKTRGALCTFADSRCHCCT